MGSRQSKPYSTPWLLDLCIPCKGEAASECKGQATGESKRQETSEFKEEATRDCRGRAVARLHYKTRQVALAARGVWGHAPHPP